MIRLTPGMFQAAGRARHPIFLFVVFCLLAVPVGVLGQQETASEAIQESISQQEQAIRSEQKGLESLSREENRLFTDLTGIEKRIAAQETRLRQQETELTAIETRLAEISRRIEQLQTDQAQSRGELRAILEGLWPVHASGLFSNRLAQAGSWDQADRIFTWYASIYRSVQLKLDEVKRRELELTRTQSRQEEIRGEVEEKLVLIQEAKDELLKDRLTLLERVQSVRARRLAKEEQLEEIRAAIEGLKYKLKSLTTRNFQDLKGYLPWPVQGRLVSGFAPGADPPVRGVGLALDGESEVRAVFWGKVVHNDQMRGFGRVVILYHGEDYYSLYAFLSESPLAIGQDVEKGEPLGRAGFYPQAEGPGLYFELRFGPKPINPMGWLVAMQ